MSRFDEVAEIVEREYFDVRFLRTRWPALRDAARLRHEAATDEESSLDALREMLDGIGVSHCVLLSEREAEERSIPVDAVLILMSGCQTSTSFTYRVEAIASKSVTMGTSPVVIMLSVILTGSLVRLNLAPRLSSN